MKLSIITVVFNAAEGLAATVNSLKRQENVDFKNIEYIIIDGGSTDGTISVIKNNLQVISQWISESDNGIYDAMNKGAGMAAGEWLYFLNAGDVFFGSDTLSCACSGLSGEHDIAYGGFVEKHPKFDVKKMPPAYFCRRDFLMRMPVCHQALFIRRTTFNDLNGFDVKYRFCADYDMLASAVLEREASTGHLGCYVCRYNVAGVSAINRWAVINEKRQITCRNMGSDRVYAMYRMAASYLACLCFMAIRHAGLLSWYRKIKHHLLGNVKC